MDPARRAPIPSTSKCYATGTSSADICRAAGETATEGVPPIGPVLPLSFKGSQSLISPSEVKNGTSAAVCKALKNAEVSNQASNDGKDNTDLQLSRRWADAALGMAASSDKAN